MSGKDVNINANYTLQSVHNKYHRPVASSQGFSWQRLVLWFGRNSNCSVCLSWAPPMFLELISKYKIVETNIGVVCSCAPSAATFFRHRPISVSSLFSLKRLRAKISKQQSSSNGFDRVNSLNSKTFDSKRRSWRLRQGQREILLGPMILGGKVLRFTPVLRHGRAEQERFRWIPRLVMPYRQLHIDENIFGSHIISFNADRFLKDKIHKPQS